MFVKLNSLVDEEMKVFYVTNVLKQGITTSTYSNVATRTRMLCTSILARGPR